MGKKQKGSKVEYLEFIFYGNHIDIFIRIIQYTIM